MGWFLATLTEISFACWLFSPGMLFKSVCSRQGGKWIPSLAVLVLIGDNMEWLRSGSSVLLALYCSGLSCTHVKP
jgi:hypothetical protein